MRRVTKGGRDYFWPGLREIGRSPIKLVGSFIANSKALLSHTLEQVQAHINFDFISCGFISSSFDSFHVAMYSKTLIVLSSGAALVAGITPTGFTPATNNDLAVVYGQVAATNGVLVDKASKFCSCSIFTGEETS